MLKALPFQKEPAPNVRHKILVSKLQGNQLYLDQIILTPKNSPRGAYVTLSLVVEFKDRRSARNFKDKKDVLSDVLIEHSSEWDYLDFKSPDGLQSIKKDIQRIFREKLKLPITNVYLVEYKIHRRRRL